MLTKQEVLAVAELADLELSEVEVEKFSAQLSGVLESFKTIDAIDLEGVEETSQVTGLSNITRADEIKCEKERTCCTTDELLKNVPDRDGNLIIVPKVELQAKSLTVSAEGETGEGMFENR